MTDALGRLVNVKQQENAALLDYGKRFKQLCDITKSQMCNKFLDESVEHQEAYQAAGIADQLIMNKTKAYKKWSAYLLIRGSDQTEYGSLLKVLKVFVSHFSLGSDQYPKTLTTATDVLSNHKIDQRCYDNKKKNRQRSRDERPTNDELATRRALHNMNVR
jgi:hypothetical protein